MGVSISDLGMSTYNFSQWWILMEGVNNRFPLFLTIWVYTIHHQDLQNQEPVFMQYVPCMVSNNMPEPI